MEFLKTNTKLEDMKIFIVDINKSIINDVDFYFHSIFNVSVVCEDIEYFLDTNSVDAVVSPGNSYGIMDGGLDLVLRDYFGLEIEEKVQKHIVEKSYGLQMVGSSFIVDTNRKNIRLIYTPTIRVPWESCDKKDIYNCMRSSLICAMENNITSIVIPCFGGKFGNAKPMTIAYSMYKAYEDLIKVPEIITWDYARKELL